MDPQACFDQWMRAVQLREWKFAAMHRDDYNAWRHRGGFMAKDDDGEPVSLIGQRGFYSTIVNDRPVTRRVMPLAAKGGAL